VAAKLSPFSILECGKASEVPHFHQKDELISHSHKDRAGSTCRISWSLEPECCRKSKNLACKGSDVGQGTFEGGLQRQRVLSRLS